MGKGFQRTPQMDVRLMFEDLGRRVPHLCTAKSRGGSKMVVEKQEIRVSFAPAPYDRDRDTVHSRPWPYRVLACQCVKTSAELFKL